MGSFGYADDIILLSPTVHGMKCMLEICADYAREYNVLFNSKKSKLITFPMSEDLMNVKLSFMNGVIECTESERHLGNLLGDVSKDSIVNELVKDFMYRVNMLKTHFISMPPDTMYSLFRTYCMPLYGSQLADLGSPSMNRFYVTWRKAIRYTLNLPRMTHCALLHLICNDVPVDVQLSFRFVQFYRSCISSKNVATRICAQLVRNGSRSSVSNSLSYVSKLFGHSRYCIENLKRNNDLGYDKHNDIIKASVIRDVLSSKQDCIMKRESLLSSQELDSLLYDLCVH